MKCRTIFPSFHLWHVLWGAVMLLAIAGCGGGSSAPPPPSTYTVSGTIRASDTVLIDSDVNDPQAAYASNDDFLTAQRLPNPATVGGYVNVAGAGAPGRSQAAGDRSDFYQLALAAGQAINLFTADDAAANLDLFLIDSSKNPVVSSQNPSGEESAISPADDTYFIEVRAVSGASIYVLTIGQASTAAGPGQSGSILDFVPGEIIVKLKNSGSAARSAAAAAGWVLSVGMNARGGAADREMLIGFDSPVGTEQAFRALGIDPNRPAPRVVDPLTQRKLDTLRIIESLRRRPDVAYAEPNYIRRPLVEPNDPFYAIQWHYPLINLAQAWNTTIGSGNVIVAVIDTGVLLGHPDLQGNLNPITAPGYDFIRDAFLAGDGDGIDNNPDDPGGYPYHGTHVAGTIAAATDNNLGVAGVAWNTLIMPLRVLARETGSVYDVLQAVRYAAGLPNDSNELPPTRADIINLSLGGGGYSQSAQDLFEDVYNLGIIVVASAGNSSTDTSSYPAAYNRVISVSAVDIDKNLAWYSNFGPTVDLAAPGGDLGTDVNADGFPDGVLSTCGDDRSGLPVEFVYCFFQGTSMAAPHVAGVAALMKAVYPDLDASKFDELVRDELITDGGAPGRDDFFGYGLIDAFKAVEQARELASGASLPATLVVEPALLNFGSVLTAETLRVENGGEPVTGVTVTSNQPWLTVSPAAVDTDGIGEYTVTVDRSGLADGIYSDVITVDAQVAGSGADVDDVFVSVSMKQDSSPVPGGNAGFHYILLLDAATREVVATQAVAHTADDYAFRFEDVAAGTYLIIAGTDSDNDLAIGDRGEAYGTYLTVGQPAELAVNDNVGGLDFETVFDLALPADQGGALPTGPTIRGRL